MKKLLLITLSAIFIIACKKQTSTPTTSNPTTTPQVTYYDLPRWYDDVLRSPLGIDSTTWTMKWDTMTAKRVGNKSYIIYNGAQYELKAYIQVYNGNPVNKVNDSVNQYYCDMFDVSGKQINNDSMLDLIVTPAITYNTTYKKWDTSYQSILAPFPPFPQKTNGSYIGTKKP